MAVFGTVPLTPGDWIAGLTLLGTLLIFVRSNTVSKDSAALSTRVSLLESQHEGHGKQIVELKAEVGKVGLQLNELYRQVVGVQEKLNANSQLFSEKFDRILDRLEGHR